MAKTKEVPEIGEYHEKFSGCLEDQEGNKRWFILGAYGREDGLPCVEYADGGRLWYEANPKRGTGFGARNAVEHRLNGPAIIRANGDQLWYKMGLIHRDGDLPAVDLVNGTKKWFVDGKCLRFSLV
jgi:hypothetical protein